MDKVCRPGDGPLQVITMSRDAGYRGYSYRNVVEAPDSTVPFSLCKAVADIASPVTEVGSISGNSAASVPTFVSVTSTSPSRYFTSVTSKRTRLRSYSSAARLSAASIRASLRRASHAAYTATASEPAAMKSEESGAHVMGTSHHNQHQKEAA